MTRKRAHIGLELKLSATLLELWAAKGQGIPFAQAAQMSPSQITALVQWHHNTPHAIGGGIRPVDLTPMLVKPHRERTAKIDVPTIAKSKRLRKAQEVHREALARKGLVPVDVTGAKDCAPVVEGCRESCTMTACAHTRNGRCVRLKGTRRWPSQKIPSRPFPKRRARP